MDPTKIGKYETRGTLGRGGVGLVYDGWDPVIARRVAIKTVRLPATADAEAAETLARFEREAKAAGRLNHPNIVGVFDSGETAEAAFIVMEFIDGRSLKAVLDGHEPLPPAEIARVMTSLLAGLQYSHDNGVVHRDIKPANIMLTARGQVKIADFGIARIESSNMTQTGAVMGTPAYMSPEQFMGQPVDGRTDIYSAGVVLFEMLTGERPFDGGMTSIMHKALNTSPPRPSELSLIAPPGFDAVVAKAMAKRPEDRFSSAAAFAEALREAMDAAAVSADDDGATLVAARPPAAPARAAPVESVPIETATAMPKRSSAPAIAALAAVVLAIAGASAWYMLPWRTAEQTVVRLEPEPTAPTGAITTPAVPPDPASPPASRTEARVAEPPPAVSPAGGPAAAASISAGAPLPSPPPAVAAAAPSPPPPLPVPAAPVQSRPEPAKPVQEAISVPPSPQPDSPAQAAPRHPPAGPLALQQPPALPREAVPGQAVPAMPVLPTPTSPGIGAVAGAFRDCPDCPGLVHIPEGSFTMGQGAREPEALPAHQVKLRGFVLGQFPVTVAEWKLCLAEHGCPDMPRMAAVEDRTPVHNLSWDDTQQYLAWLSHRSGRKYRLPTESEWEYAARGGTTTRYWWGNEVGVALANCLQCGGRQDVHVPLPVDAFKPNAFGLYDMLGGVAQWVGDCWFPNYQGAPADGAARVARGCMQRVLRGGSFRAGRDEIEVTSRGNYDVPVRYIANGFRVARDE